MTQIAKLALLVVFAVIGVDSAYAANEKGPRCSDGIDNDGDGLIDSDDPDCGGGGGDSVTVQSPLVFKDANGVVIGVAADGSNVWVTGVGRPARVPISRNAFHPVTSAELYWELPGCTGNSYLAATETAFFEPIKVNKLPNTSADIFMVSDPSQSPRIQVSSYSNREGICFESVSQVQVSPWVEITLDFVPPFSLDFQ